MQVRGREGQEVLRRGKDSYRVSVKNECVQPDICLPNFVDLWCKQEYYGRGKSDFTFYVVFFYITN